MGDKVKPTTKTEVILARIEQKLDDLKCEVSEVKQKATYTNGKIADALLKINTIETKQKDCPALSSYNKGSVFKGTTTILTLVIAGMALLISLWK